MRAIPLIWNGVAGQAVTAMGLGTAMAMDPVMGREAITGIEIGPMETVITGIGAILTAAAIMAMALTS